jgi:hypothetical protein
VVRQHLGPADQKPRIDPERPADQAEHHQGADAEPAAADRQAEAATATPLIAAAILDVVAGRQFIQAHRCLLGPLALD